MTGPRMTEAQLQSAVIEMAQTFKWRCYHTHDSRRSQAGFPDLTMVRGYTIIFAELKSETGKVSDDQYGWLDDLGDVQNVTEHVKVRVWRPNDWTTGEIERALR